MMMPTRKPLTKYPEEYRQLFLKVQREGLVVMDAGSSTHAHNMRKDLYNYRLAIWEETVRPPTEDDANLLHIADQLVFRVREEKLFITLNTSVYLDIVQQALEDMT
jgi:hypothetical protein